MTDMQLKIIERTNQPRIGNLVYRFPEPWKISAITELNNEPVVMAYNNVTRRDSQIWTRTGMQYADNAETLGQPLVFGNYVISAGECGDLIYSYRGWPAQKHFKLGWATTCCIYQGKPVVIDRPNNNADHVVVRDCLTGDTVCRMPGAYIALDSCEYDDKLWAAIGWDQGLSCNDGQLYRAKMCQSVVNHRNQLMFSSGNKVMTIDHGRIETLGELPCEKIMQLESWSSGYLYAVGANPDTLWTLDSFGNVACGGVITDGGVDEVGGACFGWCASRHYFVRTRKGSRMDNGRRTDCGEVWEIL